MQGRGRERGREAEREIQGGDRERWREGERNVSVCWPVFTSDVTGPLTDWQQLLLYLSPTHVVHMHRDAHFMDPTLALQYKVPALIISIVTILVDVNILITHLHSRPFSVFDLDVRTGQWSLCCKVCSRNEREDCSPQAPLGWSSEAFYLRPDWRVETLLCGCVSWK